MVVGLIIAFIVFRKPRQYKNIEIIRRGGRSNNKEEKCSFYNFALLAAVVVQIPTGSMILGALVGVIVLYITGALKWRQADELLTDGMRMMAFIGLVMIAASGFAAVVTDSGDVEKLVTASTSIMGDNKGLAVLIMLLIGLIVDMGIGILVCNDSNYCGYLCSDCTRIWFEPCSYYYANWNSGCIRRCWFSSFRLHFRSYGWFKCRWTT